MNEKQKLWLAEHPNFSPVDENRPVTLRAWTDRGWLFNTGRFVPDDGKTLFPHKYPAWFVGSGESRPILVGRHYEIA